MNAVANVERQLGVSMKDYNVDEAMWSALTSSIFPGAKPESIIMAVEYAKARNLDIMKKPCHIVPMNVKDAKSGNFTWRDVIMPSITEHRITASRTGQYAGQDAPIFGSIVTMKFGKVEHQVPEFCTVTVYRLTCGEKVAYSHTEYFEEACATTKEGDLNSMWTKRKRGQLSKCAEAGALRKAFPEELGNQYTKEEMEGKTINVTGDVEPAESEIQADPVGYQAYEAEQLALLRQESMNGTNALQIAHNKLKNDTFKQIFWARHSASLKQAAQQADISAKGEIYEHPPA